MGKKKEPSIQDSLKTFLDVMQRMDLKNIMYQNNILIGNTIKNGNAVGITMDSQLWQLVRDSKKIEMIPLDPTDKHYCGLFSLMENDNGWFDIDIDDFSAGKIISIPVNDHNWTVSINKDVIPLRLKKAEMNGIAYQIVSKTGVLAGNKILKVRKQFAGVVDGGTFSIIVMFIIA